MKQISHFLIIFLLGFSGLLDASIAASDRLAADEFQKLEKGQFVLTTKESESSRRWPIIVAYQLINMPPKEAFAVFINFEHQKNYIPNLIKAKIVARPNEKKQQTIDVAYELELSWPLSNSHYIHAHTVEKLGDDHYKMSWSLIESNSTEKVYGHVIFEKSQHPQYKTLMTYYSDVTPNSGLARLVRGRMLSDVENSLKKTIEELKRVYNRDSQVLTESLNLLDQWIL